MLVSIIIPVYNVQKYVRATLECVMMQTYKEIEIVVVDDGSTDASGRICDDVAAQDKRIIVYHKQNEGVSKARNFGMVKSNGDFFTFIDSDDLVEDNYIMDLVYVAQHYKVGVVRPIWKKGEFFDYGVHYDENGVCLMDKKSFDSMRYCNSIWGFYDKNVISDLYFKEEIHLCEDTLFNFSAFLMAGKMALTNRACYNYIDREGSVCRQKIGKKQLSIRKAYEVMYSLVGEDASLRDVVEKFEYGTLMDLHRHMILGGTYKDYEADFNGVRRRFMILKKKWLKFEKLSTRLLEWIFLYCPPQISIICFKLKKCLKKRIS
jgi:glycosyltransferase involved in cell wall biosynthesis